MSTRIVSASFLAFSILLITGLVFIIIGCENDNSGICYDSHTENSIVLSNKIEDHFCSCGRECYYDCYDAIIKVRYDNSTCQVNVGTYNTEEKAEKELKNYPEGSNVKILVDRNSCYLKENSKPYVIVGIVLLSISGAIFTSLILYFCLFCGKKDQKNELKTPLQV